MEIQRRRTGWQVEKFLLGDDIRFDSIGLTVAVADIYHKVDNGEMKHWLENFADLPTN